jgi:TonB family protein
MIILPSGLLDRVAEEEWNAALAHEFAHVSRRDYARNLAYQVLALPLMYHPAFWLTRTRLTESREILCDRLAADLLPSPQVYAQSLVRLAQLLLNSHRGSVSHAIGIFDAHSFERRVMQLTTLQPTARGVRAAALFGVAVTFGLGTCASALALRAAVSPFPAASPKVSRQSQEAAVKVGAGVMAGQIVSKTQPVYPQEAKDAHISGSVVMHAIIGKDGTIQNLTVLSGPPELQMSALDAVKQWVYKPYLLNGEPTEVETTITVNYSFGGQ